MYCALRASTTTPNSTLRLPKAWLAPSTTFASARKIRICGEVFWDSVPNPARFSFGEKRGKRTRFSPLARQILVAQAGAYRAGRFRGLLFQKESIAIAKTNSIARPMGLAIQQKRRTPTSWKRYCSTCYRMLSNILPKGSRSKWWYRKKKRM